MLQLNLENKDDSKRKIGHYLLVNVRELKQIDNFDSLSQKSTLDEEINQREATARKSSRFTTF